MVRLKVTIERQTTTEKIFQFLMVRLKAFFYYHCPVDLFISIPYGAIKREKDGKTIITDEKFQFLMVRLKAINNLDEKEIVRDFNSLWCD